MIGGTYRETCAEPDVAELRGSGLRAAALLSSMGATTTLHTCVDAASEAELAAQAHVFGIQVNRHPRPLGVTFVYDTPVTAPRWHYQGTPAELVVEAGRVLAFGMIDATSLVRGAAVVIDPQHEDLRGMLAATVAPSVAVVLNAHEAYQFTGLPVVEAGKALLKEGVQVAVIKQGSLGGVVFSANQVDAYGAIPTAVTRTIGSGDAFTAGFAHAWFETPDDPSAAAEFGSRVAAAHSMTGVPQVTCAQIASLPEPLKHPGETVPQVYLAGPFFTLAERRLVEMARSGLCDAGAAVFSPLHDVGRGGDEVAGVDLKGLGKSHAVLALLDGADPGTLFETGWATRAGIPVVGFASEVGDHGWTMLRGTSATLTNDLTSAIYQASWAAIKHAAVVPS